ncbi:Calmodulin-regulated spectrin-associated protein 1 [Fukomys damarensis]|uniref:Calmodulin-regulated spectrin-associated protein 1 n=1 Tax=Fukomys damarensis TaxID=885580 RepID=A0A091D4I9_FUKDA|nr:Calmodulin-regulated spectrin-associated protein 1 [Fukomys damarensis]
MIKAVVTRMVGWVESSWQALTLLRGSLLCGSQGASSQSPQGQPPNGFFLHMGRDDEDTEGISSKSPSSQESDHWMFLRQDSDSEVVDIEDSEQDFIGGDLTVIITKYTREMVSVRTRDMAKLHDVDKNKVISAAFLEEEVGEGLAVTKYELSIEKHNQTIITRQQAILKISKQQAQLLMKSPIILTPSSKSSFKDQKDPNIIAEQMGLRKVVGTSMREAGLSSSSKELFPLKKIVLMEELMRNKTSLIEVDQAHLKPWRRTARDEQKAEDELAKKRAAFLLKQQCKAEEAHM